MYKRIVVKVGTSTLTHPGGGMNLRSMDRLARVLTDVKNSGREVVLVSSGAIGAGMGKLKLAARPAELKLKQAAAAVGQCELMHLYDKFFGEYGAAVAQILLTRDDVDRPAVKRNLQNTFEALLGLGVIPVVNENDSVCFEEIETEHKVFGDNDTLSAVVATLVRADLLVLLSDIDGLYSADPHRDPDAALIADVPEITDEIRALAGGAGSRFGTGGMATKLLAAELATGAGIDMVITNGERPESLYLLAEGGATGTRFRGKRA